MKKTSTKTYSKTPGLSPGTLIYTGNQAFGDSTLVSQIKYDANHLNEKEIKNLSYLSPQEEAETTVLWINVDGIQHVEVIEKIGRLFSIHDLVLEDILNTNQRPKIEDYGSYLYIVLKMIRYDPEKNQIITEQVSLILFSNTLLSFQEHDGDMFESVRQRLRNGSTRIRKKGADYLAYAILDTIVDHYFIFLDQIGEKIEDLEERLLKNPTPETLEEIHHFKREIVCLRKHIWPLQEVLGEMANGESSLIQESTRIYFRDVYDHTIRIVDAIETLQSILTGMIDIYLSSLSHQMNSVITTLTTFATIFMPLTFIVGIYGMNFEYMPELKWKWGYPLVLLLMILIAFKMFWYFKKKKWMR